MLLIYPYPADMHKSFYTLSGLVTNQMGHTIPDGDVFIFINRSCNCMKILHMERGGLVIYHLRLESGTFNIHCGKWTELPPEITEILEHEPARFYVRRIIRHKYVGKDKSIETETPVVTAELPVMPLSKSYAGSSLLSELMVNKYVNLLPFYRQIQMFKQLGVVIPASTLNDWFRETADLLRPLYYRLREEVLSTDYIQVDESTIPVVYEEKHKTVKGYIWMVRSVMEKTVFFHYDQGSRAQKVVVGLLKNYQGALQTDGYEVYSIYQNKQGVLPLRCYLRGFLIPSCALSRNGW